MILRKAFLSWGAWLFAELTSFSAHAQATPPYAGVPSVTPLPAVPTRAVVFTPDDPGARLERFGVGLVDGVWMDGWLPICTGPCATLVPVGSRFRVGGAGIRRSSPFEIAPGATSLQLSAKTGSVVGYVSGIILIPAGGVAMIFGAMVAGFSGLCRSDDIVPHGCDNRDSAEAAGYAAVGLGATAILGGILLVVYNGTSVSGLEPANRTAHAGPRLTWRGVEF